MCWSFSRTCRLQAAGSCLRLISSQIARPFAREHPCVVLFYEGDECCDMVPGKLIRMAPGRPHRLEAKQDSRLRPAPRERRHSTVFYAFDNLAPSESFLLVNDDPQPLHAQMEELRPGELTWEYEVQGPYEFRIKVSWVASSSAPRPETAMASCSH